MNNWMATPSYAPGQTVLAHPTEPVTVISPQFCVPYPVGLIISRKMLTLSEGSFGVTDINGNLMFKIKGQLFSLRDRRILQDAAGNPVVSFQQKIFTAHRRWQAFRGDSSDSKDLLFSVKKSSLLQFKTKLDVIMASNTQKDACDFRIEGDWFERECTIYVGNSNVVIAQMHRKHSVSSILLDKDTFSVTCYPQVDNAFIVALIVILEEINEDRKGED